MKKLYAIALLLVFILALAGCDPTQHDGVYADDAKLADADRYYVTGFAGNGTQAKYEFAISSISGAETIWKFSAEGGEAVRLAFSLEEKNGGSAKLVLVDPDGNVTTLAEASSARQADEYSFEAGRGAYAVKIAGKGQAGVTGHLQFSHGAASTS